MPDRAIAAAAPISGLWARRLAALGLPGAMLTVLALATVLPIAALLSRAFYDRDGAFVGLANFVRYATEPGLSIAAWNSVYLSSIATVVVVALAYPVAFALTRSRMPLKGLFRLLLMLPLLAPSLLPAFGLVYLFGNQGWLNSWLFGAKLYGEVGIVLASIIYALPHAVLILTGGLAAGDARLYEAARALKAGPWRRFRTVTLPGSRYALVSAASVVFVLVFTDFGIPSVVGGSTNVLSSDIYKLVIGRFDFEMGAVVGVLLLAPAVVAYGVDTIARRYQRGAISGKSTPIEPDPGLARDGALTLFTALIAGAIAGVFCMAIFGSLVKFWPYNLTLGLQNYERLLADADEARSIVNSLVMAGSTALAGATLVMITGWLVARRIGNPGLTQAMQALAMVPVAVPGLVLGLGYVFFFNNPGNPLHFLQGTMALIVLCSVAHFYTVPHLMAVGGLLQLDREIDLAATALRAGPVTAGRKIHLPVLLPTLIDIAGYFFVNAMTTVSALIFLFTAQTRVAAIAVVNLIEGSRIGQAAALATVIMAISTVAALIQAGLRRGVTRAQPWRGPAA